MQRGTVRAPLCLSKRRRGKIEIAASGHGRNSVCLPSASCFTGTAISVFVRLHSLYKQSIFGVTSHRSGLDRRIFRYLFLPHANFAALSPTARPSSIVICFSIDPTVSTDLISNQSLWNFVSFQSKERECPEVGMEAEQKGPEEEKETNGIRVAGQIGLSGNILSLYSSSGRPPSRQHTSMQAWHRFDWLRSVRPFFPSRLGQRQEEDVSGA
ncbi:unnamed protein product [Protopolystoma xenopodis]|uniref:Uncharacterized protein n=1 Tax=Protopolystoma xenopodis TaxID=117903 RepID=A0A3S5B139_9PLAT|nr:unnamed protein product [Protopolystoma xenopodis]